MVSFGLDHLVGGARAPLGWRDRSPLPLLSDDRAAVALRGLGSVPGRSLGRGAPPGLAGTIDPHSVYNHSAAVAHPWKWAAIHGAVRDRRGDRRGGRVAPQRGRPGRDRALRTARLATARSGSRALSRTRRSGWRSPASSPASSAAMLQVNAAMAGLTGYTQEELLTMSAPEITHPDDVSEGLVVSRQMASGSAGGGRTLDKRYVHADGRDHLGACGTSRWFATRPATRSTPWCRCRT